MNGVKHVSMKQANIVIQQVENGFTININSVGENGRNAQRPLVATSEADAKKTLHTAIDKLFETETEPKKG